MLPISLAAVGRLLPARPFSSLLPTLARLQAPTKASECNVTELSILSGRTVPRQGVVNECAGRVAVRNQSDLQGQQ